MSSFASAWAWDQPVKQNEKLLLLFLADSADRSGLGSNLSDLIGHAEVVCGFEGQTVKKHFEFLEESDLVKRTDDDGYRLNLGDRRPQRGAFRLDLE